MALYLEDRRELRAAIREITGDVKAIRSELDRDDGRDVAEEAAEVALEKRRTSRSQLVRDLGLVVAGSILAIVVRVLTVLLGFG